jgi:hypothetical protein
MYRTSRCGACGTESDAEEVMAVPPSGKLSPFSFMVLPWMANTKAYRRSSDGFCVSDSWMNDQIHGRMDEWSGYGVFGLGV